MTADQPKSSAPKRLMRWVRPVMLLIAVLFIAFAARRFHAQWQGDAVAIHWQWALLSIVPHALGVVILALGWRRLLVHLAGKPIPLLESVTLQLESQVARYIPGKMGVPLVRMAGAESIGVRPALAGASVFIETLSFLAVGFILGLSMLYATGDLAGQVLKLVGGLALPAVGLLVAGLLVMAVVPRSRLLQRLVSWFKLDGAGPLVPVQLLGWHAVHWAMWAAHGYCVCIALGSAPGSALGNSALFVLAPMLGMLALAAPAGIGVREAVLSLGIAPQLGPEAALAAVGISRAATLLVDFGSWLTARALLARRRRAALGSHPPIAH